jgi:RecA-family ATPase
LSLLPVTPAHRLAERAAEQRWLVSSLWSEEAVGIIGGEPKCCKSFLALDLAVSVAAGTPCLRRFAVPRPRRVLLYAAEDALHMVLSQICVRTRRATAGLSRLTPRERRPEVATQTWVAPLLDWEEQQRACRSLERRLQTAHIGRFKPLCDFDWNWPKRCDRAAIEALMALDFLKEAANIVVVGPNGVGKSTLAQNIAHQALIQGHTVLFTSAGQVLGDLCALDSDSALRRRLRHYARPQ